MHGRIKVKTTAEQEEEKRKERERKLQLFRKATAVAFHKIGEKEYDKTGLDVTGEILSRNSDFSTMWNYRKKAFIAMKNDPEEDFQKLAEDELELLVMCLRNNPKSYGCWHHRCFIMQNIPTPDWKKELKLCDQFLQFDDRNFHCWDYRRFVVKNSVPAVHIDDEIRCTNNLIENNFSNYSSWHYRSKLLPQRYPSVKSSEQIEENKLLEELEYVQNAFFTDPNDQSAWFYNQWLIGRGEQSQSLVAAHFNRSASSVICILRKPLSLDMIEQNSMICVSGEEQKGKWKPLLESDHIQYQYAWIFNMEKGTPEGDLSISFSFFGESSTMQVGCKAVEHSSVFFFNNEFREVLGEGKLLVLKSELGSCIELNDLEPGNKWIVLTLVRLMNVINPEKYRDDINKFVSELQSIDPSRKNYFADLKSRIFIEQSVSSGKAAQLSVDLSGMGLTRFCHFQYFSCIRSLNISNNVLKRLDGSFFLFLCCEELLAEENEIVDISGIENMPKLSNLSLNHNSLKNPEQLQSLKSCPALKTVSLLNNLFQCNVDDIKSMLPNVAFVF